jgi:serine beta-lactamase-like protein LACTB, mitochondrial
LSDIENNVHAHKDSVWRTGSIAKPLTSALVGKLVDEGKLDFEKSIHQYLPTTLFPQKTWNNKNVDITLKQVMSHTAGLRESKAPDDAYNHVFEATSVNDPVNQSIKLDPLIFEPGHNCIYSNYGHLIVGAVIESVFAGHGTYESEINKLFQELGMTSTQCERRNTIIPHRARYYQKYEKMNNMLGNSEVYDDLVSLEGWWPAGGIVSTVPDLLRFGYAMITSSKHGVDEKPGNK